MTAEEFVASVRQKNGLTLQYVAERSGVSVTFLSDVEHGRRKLTPQTAKKLALALGVYWPPLVQMVLQSYVPDMGLIVKVVDVNE